VTARTAPAPAFTDWSRHHVNATPKPCRICGGNAYMTDAAGRPCHLVCGKPEAEREIQQKAERYAGGDGA
jgi:hypothetical protein